MPEARSASDLHAFEFCVSEEEAGQRLDRYLVARQLPPSRSQIKKHIDAGCCEVNGVKARPACKLRPGDTVLFFLPPPEPSRVEAEEIALSVLFEDDDLIVVDKPAGMVVHPAPGHRRGTLVGALLHHCETLSGVGGELRPGIVHRLDKLTSGVMVASKTDAAHQGLAAQFTAHSIERRYLAIVSGVPTPAKGAFDTLHGRHPTDRKRYSSKVDRGRRAVTHYRVLEAFGRAALMEARLETGRTHQVRVHFADAGHGLVGDPVYGRAGRDALLRGLGEALNRQALHARTLAFDHPRSGERLRFATPPPPDFLRALSALRQEGVDVRR